MTDEHFENDGAQNPGAIARLDRMYEMLALEQQVEAWRAIALNLGEMLNAETNRRASSMGSSGSKDPRGRL